MFSAITKLFKHPPAGQIQADQLAKAERELLAFEEAVEYNTAMRDMLKARLVRLNQN